MRRILAIVCLALGAGPACGGTATTTELVPIDTTSTADAGSSEVGAQPGTAICGGTTVDLRTDPSNCGACGHACGAGLCSASMCQPATLADGQGDLSSIAVDETGVYWTTYGLGPSNAGLYKMSHHASIPSWLADGVAPAGVVADGQNVYWYDSGKILTVPAGGGPVRLIATGEQPKGLTLDGRFIYWVNRDGSMRKAPLNAGATIEIAPGGIPGEGIAFCRGFVYTSYYLDGNVGGISRVATAGGPFQSIVSLRANPREISVQGDYVYFLTWSPQSMLGATTWDGIMRVPVGGGNATMIAPNQVAARGIVVDGDRVYWIAERAVRSVAIGGGPITELATGIDVAGLAVGTHGVYFTDAAKGTVSLVAK